MNIDTTINHGFDIVLKDSKIVKYSEYHHVYPLRTVSNYVFLMKNAPKWQFFDFISF